MNTQTTQDNGVNWGKLLNAALSNWYWFALSLFLSFGITYFILKSTPKTYSRVASVVIDDGRGGKYASEAAAFEELGLFDTKLSVENEEFIFKSKRLMMDVVKRLNLDINYKIEKKLLDLDLYQQTPIRVVFPEAHKSMNLELMIKPLSDNEVELFGFFVSGEEVGGNKAMKIHLNDTVMTPVGKIVVMPTLYYSDYLNEEIKVEKRNLESVALAYSSSITTELATPKSTIINLIIKDAVPQRAEDVLNTLIDVYVEDAVNDKNIVASNTANFINERLIIIEQELGGVDSEIADYKIENQLTDINSESQMYLQTTTTYKKEELDLENQKTIALYIRDYLDDPTKMSSLIPANAVLSDGNVNAQINEYNTLLLKRDKLVGGGSIHNPVVKDLNNSLTSMRQTIIRSMDNLIVGLNMQLKNIQEQDQRTQRRISAVPQQQKHVLSIERQQKIKESLYLYLLNKREENAISQTLTKSNIRIVDSAMGSATPIAPNVRNILILALLIGLLIPGGIIYMIVLLDNRIHTRKDLEGQLTVPFLGDIPVNDSSKGEDQGIVIGDDAHDPVSEAFRILRSNMDFMWQQKETSQVVMMTSMNPGSGKTFVSSNLSMTLAMTGKKVVLVDLDIRKGTLSSRLGKKDTGVTNYLMGAVDNVDSITRPSGYHPCLDIVSNGPIPPNPAELLLSDRLDLLINNLKKKYDYIIIDNVPSGMIADAVIVNRVADITLYVIRAGLLDKRQLSDIEKLYIERKFKNMAVVLNGVKTYRSRYGYYGYAYGYYGYGPDSPKNKKQKRQKKSK